MKLNGVVFDVTADQFADVSAPRAYIEGPTSNADFADVLVDAYVLAAEGGVGMP